MDEHKEREREMKQLTQLLQFSGVHIKTSVGLLLLK
jgi:hypothetical protein